jgi:hypothetical protein
MVIANGSDEDPGWTISQQLGHPLDEFDGSPWLPAPPNFLRYLFRHITT